MSNPFDPQTQYDPIIVCPKCGSDKLIEDDGLKCQDCDWEDENEIDFDE